MHPRTAILLAAAVLFVISAWMPFGSTILYPLTLFTTWVHEMGHGLTALAVGGEFDSLVIRSDAGGYAMIRVFDGWPDALSDAGGLLAPPIVGSFILAFVHGPRRARIVLGLLAAALGLSVLVYVRSLTGVIAMPIVAALLGWASWRGFAENPHRRVILAQMLGVMLALDTVTRMVGYAMSTEARPGEKSDVQRIADQLGGPYWIWGLAIITIALSMLALSGWWAWRRPELADRAAGRSR
ncbi:MAG TPA: M50 family metallopeptidase [Kofleriaceae bacterium]|nr:M50 family metallopeptidase [Kofleriaceae bacterium]